MATKPLPVHGVDISHHQQQKLDMFGAKQRGLRWLYHKATEGTAVKDARYHDRRREAAASGLPFGAYHFARADRGDAVAEARFFLSYAAPKPGDLRPCLDLETMEGLTLGQIRVWASEFIAEVKRQTGHAPVVYTPFDLGTVDDACIIWRPRYNNDNRPPVMPWDIWQFSNGVWGVPRELAGIGRVDLNYMQPSLKMSQMLLPAKPIKPVKPKKTVRMRCMEASLQFSDSTLQKKADAKTIFSRAKTRGVWWVAGTEAFEQNGHEALAEAAKKYGYRFWHPRSTDSWIAVKESRIAKGSWSTYYDKVLDGKAGVGTDQGVLSVSWLDRNPGVGEIHVIAGHFKTKGDPTSKDPARRVNVGDNRKLATAIGTYAQKVGAGRPLVFFAGDTNIVDSAGDVFFGQPLTTAGDELKRWPNTGYGPIDVIASYDHDSRVEAVMWRALTDKQLHMHSDHYVVEAGFDIEWKLAPA